MMTTKDPLWPDEAPYGYADWNPTTVTDEEGYSGEHAGHGKPKKKDYCAPGGSDRFHPTNDCSKCGPGCKPVFMTHYNVPGRLAVYCHPYDTCDDAHNRTSCKCSWFCQWSSCCPHLTGKPPFTTHLRPYPIGIPVFPRGSNVCIHGAKGTTFRLSHINDCGCGQRQKPINHVPNPDNWMDYGNSPFEDGWRCVCPGKCKGKKKKK